MNMHYPFIEKKQAPDWSAEELALLRKLWNSGMCFKEIVRRIPGRTASASSKQIHRLKLGHRRPGNLKRYQAFHASPDLAEKIRVNAVALGITRAEYCRRACERFPVDVVAK